MGKHPCQPPPAQMPPHQEQKPPPQPKQQLPIVPEKGLLEKGDLRLPNQLGKNHLLIRCHLETQLSSGLIIAMILREGWE